MQFLLDRLGDEAVRLELLQSTEVPVLLTESNLAALDEFYKLVGPERDQNIRLVLISLRYFSLKSLFTVLL